MSPDLAVTASTAIQPQVQYSYDDVSPIIPDLTAAVTAKIQPAPAKTSILTHLVPILFGILILKGKSSNKK